MDVLRVTAAAVPIDNIKYPRLFIKLESLFSVKIQDFQLFENHIAVYERENGLPKPTVYRLPATGEAVGQLQGGQSIDFVDPAYAVEPESSQFHSNVIRFYYSSMRTPPSIFDYDMDTGVSVLKKIDTVSYHLHHLVFVYPIFNNTSAIGTICTAALESPFIPGYTVAQFQR
jgi:hypothetical protein